jgi:cytochrome c-type protein NapC
MWDHMLGTKELFAFAFQGIRTTEDFEGIRFEVANRVRMRMLANDSKNCRSCHVMAAIQPERKRGQRQHKEAREEGITCIACHYNLVHKDVSPSDEFEEAISNQ